jgi:hypothetical protein
MAESEHLYTPSGKVKWPELEMVCERIKTAWARISPELIVKSFKKCGISNALYGSEDNVLWDSNSNDASCDDDDGKED